MTEDKGETICLVKFNGEDANWHEWSMKTLALAKTRGFKNAYMKDTNPCSDINYVLLFIFLHDNLSHDC